MGDEAVVKRLAPICVVQFNREPEKDRKLKELKAISGWQRADGGGAQAGNLARLLGEGSSRRRSGTSSRA